MIDQKGCFWHFPRSFIKSKNNWFMGLEYWWPVMVFEFQSMSGRLKSPINQKTDFLNLSFISLISLHISRHWLWDKSGARYAQHTIKGGLFRIGTLAKTVSETLPFAIKILLKIFLIPMRTPPPPFFSPRMDVEVALDTPTLNSSTGYFVNWSFTIFQQPFKLLFNVLSEKCPVKSMFVYCLLWILIYRVIVLIFMASTMVGSLFCHNICDCTPSCIIFKEGLICTLSNLLF